MPTKREYIKPALNPTTETNTDTETNTNSNDLDSLLECLQNLSFEPTIQVDDRRPQVK